MDQDNVPFTPISLEVYIDFHYRYSSVFDSIFILLSNLFKATSFCKTLALTDKAVTYSHSGMEWAYLGFVQFLVAQQGHCNGLNI